MKKNALFFIVCWVILVAIFNVLCFVIPAQLFGVSHFDTTFWIGWAFVMLAFIGHLLCSLYICKEKNVGRLFYKIPLLNVAYTMLVVNVIVGVVCMVIPVIPPWVAIIACLLTLAFNIIAVAKSVIAKNAVEGVDEKIKSATMTIRTLIVDAEVLMKRALSDDVKAECKKVYEAIRYSDPMSVPALAGIESNISLKFFELAAAVDEDDADNAKRIARTAIDLIDERNAKCKLLK